MKRLTWFVAGAAAGAAGGQYASRKARRAAAQLRPRTVARTVALKVQVRAQDVAAAVKEGRDAMRAKEAELRAVRDGSLAGGEPGQVIVLREVRDVQAPLEAAITHPSALPAYDGSHTRLRRRSRRR
jgi:hypothetical protein